MSAVHPACSWLLAILVWAVPVLGWAQTPQAPGVAQSAALEAEAKALARAGRLAEAIERYRAAYAILPRAGTRFNLAQTHLRAGKAMLGPDRAAHYRAAVPGGAAKLE